MKNITFIANVLIGVALAILRIAGVKHEAFQAVAHLCVGGYYTVWITDRSKKQYLYLALILTAIELACFLIHLR